MKNLNVHNMNVKGLNIVNLNYVGSRDGTNTAFGGYVKDGLVLQLDCAQKFVDTTAQTWKSCKGVTFSSIQSEPYSPISIGDNGGIVSSGDISIVLHNGLVLDSSKKYTIEVCAKVTRLGETIEYMPQGSCSLFFAKQGCGQASVSPLYGDSIVTRYPDESKTRIIVKSYDYTPTIGDVVTASVSINDIYANNVKVSSGRTEEGQTTISSESGISIFILDGIEIFSVRVYEGELSNEARYHNFETDLARFVFNDVDFDPETEYVYKMAGTSEISKTPYTTLQPFWGKEVDFIWNIPNKYSNFYHLCGGASDINYPKYVNFSTYNGHPTGLSVTVYKSKSISMIDLSNIDIVNVPELNQTVANCSSLISVGDLSKWDVSNVNKLIYTFQSCSSLKFVGDLSNWNTSNVNTFANMFSNCSSLTLVGDLSGWNTSKATAMNNMFAGCMSLTSLGIPPVPSNCNANWMFSGCTSLTTILGCGKLSVSLSFGSCPLTAESVKIVLNALDRDVEDATLTLRSGIINRSANPDLYEIIDDLIENTGWDIAGV